MRYKKTPCGGYTKNGAKSNVLCLFTVGEQRKPLIHKAFRYPCSLFFIFTNINKKNKYK